MNVREGGPAVENKLDNPRVLQASAVIVAALAILLLAPAAAFAAYAPWVAQTSGTAQTLNAVAFADASSGWAVGAGGTIRHTANGGVKWTAQTTGTTQTLYGVAFADTSNGWAVGGSGTILRTTNGGTSWSAVKSGTTQTLYGVAFADAANGWAVGNRGTILHTTNGGGKWTVQTSGTRWTLYGVACADGDTCWVVGAKGTVRRSVDAGATWAGQSAGAKGTLYAVAFVDGSNGWIAGSAGTVQTTTNGGRAWTARSVGGGSTLYALTRPDASRGWVAGSSGAIRATADSTSWSAQGSGTTQTLRGLAARGSHAWAVGGGGAILTYNPDLLAPVTTATGLQADDHSGWTNAPVSVTLSAVDAGRAGVSATYYTVDAGTQTKYSTPFAVSGERQHRVTYWSVDQAGNVEGIHTGFVNVDLTAPTVAHDPDTAWHTGDVTVQLRVDDKGGSGAAAEYRLAGTTVWQPTSGDAFVVVAAAVGDGPHAYEFRAVDGAGNASDPGACTVKIDVTAPTTTATGLGDDELSAWSTPATTRTVSLAADDGAGSGVSGGNIHYTLDGVAYTYTGPFVVSGVKQHKVTYWSVDDIGHQEAERTGWVNIADFYAQSQGLAADETSGWYKGPANITITPGGGPGELSICYQLDGGATQTVVGSTSFPVDGTVAGVGHHKVEFWALQGSLASAHQTGYVNIDTTKPVTTLATPAPTRWVNQAVTLIYKVTDVAGVEATYSRVDGAAAVAGAELLLPAPLTHAGDGRFVVQYWSLDRAGNTETAKSVTVKIDTVRPTLSARYAASVLRNATARLRFVVKDKTLYRYGVKAAARIVIKNSHNHVVKTIKKSVKTGVGSTASFRCTLARGKYKFYVYATDPAGNKQVKVVSNRLSVR
jgi:photosystem II stability/assembly factor-like uncharacterized protein